MPVNLIPAPVQHFVDSNGAALVGGLLYTYAAGTNTPQATYSDAAGTVANTNPIVLNARGECTYYLTSNQSYKLVLQDSLGNTIWTADNVAGAPTTAALPFAQCRLAKSGANLVLSPYGGNQLTINGALFTIPSAGVSLSPSGTAATTGYYIYAFMNSSVMTLEFSTTAYATSTTTGIATKSGDATRTLVGQAATAGAGVWSTSTLHCLSYFNRKLASATGSFTVARVNASTYPTYSETNSEIRVPFLVWSDTLVRADFNGYVSNASLGGLCYSSIGFDNTGATAEDGGSVFTSYTANASGSPTCFAVKTGLAELTLHYATQLGSATTGNATYSGSALSISRCALQVTLQG